MVCKLPVLHAFERSETATALERLSGESHPELEMCTELVQPIKLALPCLGTSLVDGQGPIISIIILYVRGNALSFCSVASGVN